jgi:hypothetical protein
MRERIVVGIWLLIAESVSIAFPVVAHAPPSADSESSYDAPEALQHALMTIPAASSSAQESAQELHAQSQHSHPRQRLRSSVAAGDPAQPVVTVPRGITATISGVTIAGGRVGVLVIGRSSLDFTMVSENLSGGIEVRDSEPLRPTSSGQSE